MIRPAAVAVLLALMSPPSARAETVLLHAAGSLRPAMMDIAATYQAKFGDSVQPKFGASGLLKDEIAGGAKAEVFASANMEHPAALASAGRAGPVVLFVRNRLCALVRPGLAIESGSLLDAMLDPHIKLGTSTPQADPSGDDAWAVFRKAEAMHPGAYAALDAKALKLTGGPATPAAPEGRTIYSVLLEQSAADMFLAYCTSAESAHAENPGQQVIALPEALAVGADYGLTVVAGASLAAYRFALFILSPDAQRIFERHGFTAPNLATDRGDRMPDASGSDPGRPDRPRPKRPLNVFGEPLAECCAKPLTGFYRTGSCETGPEDFGVHTVCARVDADFLAFSREAGNDLSTPFPAAGFAGLKPGDCWCLCAARWKEAFDAGKALKLRLAATHEATLQIVPLDLLKKHALDLS